MASESLRLLWGALRILGLCMLLLLPVFTANHGMLVGGWRERSVSDPDVQNAAAFAVDAYNKGSNSLYYCRPVEIIKAQSQVVSGIKYCMKILMVNTQCDKRRRQRLTQVDLGRCPLPPKSEQQRQTCIFCVWSRPWLNDTQLTSMNCS